MVVSSIIKLIEPGINVRYIKTLGLAAKNVLYEKREVVTRTHAGQCADLSTLPNPTHLPACLPAYLQCCWAYCINRLS